MTLLENGLQAEPLRRQITDKRTKKTQEAKWRSSSVWESPKASSAGIDTPLAAPQQTGRVRGDPWRQFGIRSDLYVPVIRAIASFGFHQQSNRFQECMWQGNRLQVVFKRLRKMTRPQNNYSQKYMGREDHFGSFPLSWLVWQEVCASLFFTSRTKSWLSLQTRRFEFSLPGLPLSVSLKSLKNTTRHEMPNGLRKEN